MWTGASEQDQIIIGVNMYKPLHLPLIATLSASLFVSACSGPDMPAGSVKESAAEGVVLSAVPSGSCDQYDENGTALFAVGRTGRPDSSVPSRGCRTDRTGLLKAAKTVRSSIVQPRRPYSA